MGETVSLFVYDLSRGLAQQWGRMLTGKDVEGIWHTSIVVFDYEIFYGQGISIVSPPGTTHHGTPFRQISLGTTYLDHETVLEYIREMQQVYTPEKYHLLDFNCNTFTNEFAGFLNQSSIPQYILDLPAEIMSTPFGQSMRPMIDQMFSGRDGPPPSASDTIDNLLPQVIASRTAHKPAHHAISTPTLDQLSRNLAPISYTTKPNFTQLKRKLESVLEQYKNVPAATRTCFTTVVIPQLENGKDMDEFQTSEWIKSSEELLRIISLEQSFPVLDLLRVGLVSKPSTVFLSNIFTLLPSLLTTFSTQEVLEVPRPGKATLLTLLKLLTNSLSHTSLSAYVLNPKGGLDGVTRTVIRGLLDEDASVRSTAAGLGWCMAAGKYAAKNENAITEEWGIEMVVVLLEALKRENISHEVAHRLTASLGLLLYKSEHYESLRDILIALDASEKLQTKLQAEFVSNNDASNLLQEVSKLISL